MTVCIAAICQGPGDLPYIIGATDRKVTAQNIQYEPDSPLKVWNLGQGNVALIAGETDAQTEICGQVWFKRPQSVREAVTAYSESLTIYNYRHAERAVLSQYGLTMEQFLDGQRGMQPEFFDQLNRGILEQKADVAAIICGIDRFGPQIYVVDHLGRDFANTSVGFAAIGDGGRHAASQFMFAKYSPQWSLSRALFLLYTAKVHAEVAPGVGQETDMFFISYPGSKPSPLNDELIAAIKMGYDHVKESHENEVRAINADLAHYLNQLLERGQPTTGTAQTEQTTQPEAPTEPDDPSVNET